MGVLFLVLLSVGALTACATTPPGSITFGSAENPETTFPAAPQLRPRMGEITEITTAVSFADATRCCRSGHRPTICCAGTAYRMREIPASGVPTWID